MLETPITGRYTREEKQLIFEPYAPYMGLVYACIGGGALFFLIGGNEIVKFTGAAVALAGTWAYFSVVRIVFDLRSKMYRRRQGPGFIPRLWQGQIAELDALVVIAEPSMVSPGVVRYHLVLHWKQRRAPLMVLESVPIRSTGNLHLDGRGMVAKAMRYGQSLGVPVYDNTHFASPCPVPVF